MLLALPFLLIVLLALPAFAWMSALKSKAASPSDFDNISLKAISIQILVTQVTVAALAWLAMYGAGLEISLTTEISPFIFGVGWLALGVFLTIAFFEARRPLDENDGLRRRLRKISAGNPDWLGVTMLAGIVEEFAYRGALTLLLAQMIGYWPGAVVSALVFSLSHLSSGKRAALIGFLFALAMQYVVFVSGGLLIAILVHAVYDIVVTALGWRMAKQETGDAT